MHARPPRPWIIALAAGALCLTAPPAQAGFVAVSGNLSAQADFVVVNNTLSVTLANTATVAPTASNQVLTGIAIQYGGSGSILFSPLAMGNTSAVAAASANYSGTFNGFANDIGGEWAFRSGVTLQNNTAFSYGLSSTGLNVYGPGDRFNTNNLEGPDSLNGVEWGIVNAGYVNGSGNGGINSTGFVRGAATFRFAVSGGFDVRLITGVRFLYGTDLSEPFVDGGFDGNGDTGGGGGPLNVVPAPSGLVLFATALPILGLIARRRLHPPAAA